MPVCRQRVRQKLQINPKTTNKTKQKRKEIFSFFFILNNKLYKIISIKTYITAMLFFNGEASSPTLVADLAPYEYETKT
jgi:hypothetical protein